MSGIELKVLVLALGLELHEMIDDSIQRRSCWVHSRLAGAWANGELVFWSRYPLAGRIVLLVYECCWSWIMSVALFSHQTH